MRWISLILALAISLLVATCAVAPAYADCKTCRDIGLSPWFTLNGLQMEVPGAVDFCKREPRSCRSDNSAEAIVMDEATMAAIEKINLEVNRRVTAAADKRLYGQEEFWSYATQGQGDCEDYVLEKRRALKKLGLPQNAMPIVVVRTHKGEWHALLGIRTPDSIYFLDNLDNKIRGIFSKPYYTFLAIQEPRSFEVFNSINGVRM